jgi:hypothetical protein
MQQRTGALITFFHVKNSDLIKIVDSWNTGKSKLKTKLTQLTCKLLNEKLKWWLCHVCSSAQWIPTLPKKKSPICYGESSLLFCITHSLIHPLDSVNRANFWDPTKSLYFNPEWSTTRLINQNPKTHKIYLLLLRKQFLYCNLYMPKKGHGKTFLQAVRNKNSDNKVILKVSLCLGPCFTL